MFSFYLSSVSWNPARAETSENGTYARAQEEFSRRQYSKSLSLFREYLRNHPNDQDAWTRFGASYYHTGQAEQALVYLRRAKVSPGLKSFNLYYQALCFDALGDYPRARRLLQKVSRSGDPLADDALFEKAAIEFAEGDAGAAKVSAEDYRRLYRNGRYRAQVDEILANLGIIGGREIADSQRSLYRKTFFTSHPLSLMPIPHGWVYQIGYDGVSGTRVSPVSNPNIEPPSKSFTQHTLIAKAGLSLGPFLAGGSTSTFAYVYGQNWLSDSERLSVYAENPLDFEYFFFRPDLMERSHRFVAETIYPIGTFDLGVYGHYEFIKGGSSLFPAPERKEIRQVYNIATSVTLIPWIQWRLRPYQTLRASVYFDKYLDAKQTDFSYKTYNFKGGIANGTLPSMALEYSSLWKSYNLASKLELFRWAYIYNDYWEGYVATGGTASLQLLPTTAIPWPVYLTGRLTLAQRDYTSAIIKSTPCGGGEGPPTTCPRQELFVNYGATLSYIRNNQQAFSVLFDYHQRENATLKVYNESAFDFLFVLTHAFPNLDSGAKFLEPPRGLYQTRGY